jgi:hypothetical protein
MIRALPDLTVRNWMILRDLVSKLSANAGVVLGKDADMQNAASGFTLTVAERGVDTTPARCERQGRKRSGRMILQTLGEEALWYETPVDLFSCAALLKTITSEAMFSTSKQRRRKRLETR